MPRFVLGISLAMLEIVRGLSDAQLAGTVTVAELPAATSVENAFGRRIAALPDDCGRALVVAAAGEALPVGQILAACALLDLRPDLLGLARECGVLAIEGERLGFSHPIMRRVAYRAARDGDRRAAHQALATILGLEDDAERRSWHLGQAAAGPNGVAAAALESSAIDAVARNAPAIAGELFERAAELAVDRGESERLLIEAARQGQLAGPPDRLLALLDRVLDGVVDPRRRADAQRLRAAGQAARGNVRAAAQLLVDEAASVERIDPERAVQMLIEACGLIWLMGNVKVSLPIARHAHALAQALREPGASFAGLTLGTLLVICGEPEPGRQLVLDHATDPDGNEPRILSGSQELGLLWLDEFTRADDYFDRLCARARASSAPSLLCSALAPRSQVRFRLGRWSAAYADASESLRLAHDTDQRLLNCYSLATMALIEAARGEDACYTHATQAIQLADAHGLGGFRSLALASLGHGALAMDRMDSAIPPLEEVDRLYAEWGVVNPAAVHSAPDLIESYVRVGDLEQARQRLDTLMAQASQSASRFALASTYRCEGMLATADEYQTWFERALAEHERLPTPFDHARTQLSYGERLRRARRKTDARFQLEHARTTFERLDARPWADRARAELNALGIHVPRTQAPASNTLTPQELRVATMISEGATNREAGAALFLSPKTIEAHLSRIYRKLAIRSRTELAALLAREGALDREPTAASLGAAR